MAIECIDRNEIKKIFGIDTYRKSLKINDSAITKYHAYRNEDKSITSMFYVFCSRNYYRVVLNTKFTNLLGTSCTCLEFNKYNKCEHILAVLTNCYNDLFWVQPSQEELSKQLLKKLVIKEVKNVSNIKEAMNIELILYIHNKKYLEYTLKIGNNKKTYSLNSRSKVDNFIKAMKSGEELELGKAFTYQKDKYFFKEQDKLIVDYLFNYEKNTGSYYYSNDYNLLIGREAEVFLNMIKDYKFQIKDYGMIEGIKYEFPTNANLDLKNDKYTLNFTNYDKFRFISDEKDMLIYNNYLYILDDNYKNIFKLMDELEINNIVFDKKNESTFKKGLLRNIKNNLSVGENVKMIINTKPEVSLYIDFYNNKIGIVPEYDYNGTKIKHFDNNRNIVRDEDTENALLEDLLTYNFIIDNNSIYLEDTDDIGTFLEYGLDYLAKHYTLYTSKKIDNMNIIKKSNISSNFSIGYDNILSYKFDVDNIDQNELNNLFKDLKAKKKYYKLKNGNLVNLEDNNELSELNSLLEDLGLSKEEILTGSAEIPKYRAFYIDSLKRNKYNRINTDNSFDTFINNFKKYKDIELNIDDSDSSILREYQKEGIKWLYTLYKCDLGGILADEMGLGKSIQTIIFIKSILKDKPNSKILIVCPTSLVYNWKHEFEKFAPNIKYVTVAEEKKKRLEIIEHKDDYNVFITSYGLIRNDNDEYEKIDFELCVIDEAQYIKNFQSEMSKEIKKIKAKTKIALTGTPIENSVLELWNIFDYLMPGYLGSINNFKSKYGIKDIDSESLDKLSLLNYQITPFILRRKKKEVIKDLPDKIENDIYLDLPDKQRALYLKVLTESKKEIDDLVATNGFIKSRFKILQLLMKLRQLCIDPTMLYSNYNEENIKLEKLLDIVKNLVSDGHKILIFSSFTMVLDHVKKVFDKEKITNYMIKGDVKSKERLNLVDKFNSDDTNCFLISLKSGGTGLNLTSADIVIHLDIWWNPQAENQATDRAHRIGQNNKVTVIRLITNGTIEERIIDLQNKKKILSENLIEGKNNSETISTLTEEDMQKLLEIGNDDIE